MPSETLTKFILLYPEWPPGSALFLVLIQPIRRARPKWPFRRWFCLHPAADNPFLFAKTLTVPKNDWKKFPEHWQESTQITGIDRSIICSVDVSLRSIGAKTRRNLQSTVPSATALRETICFCLPDGEVSQYLGAGNATFVCGSCTCRLNRFDTIRWKYEAVKEDLQAQEREILLWQSQAQAQLQPRPQRVSCDFVRQSDSSMEKLAVWTQIWHWLAEIIRVLRGKTNDLGQCLNLSFSALPRECTSDKASVFFFFFVFVFKDKHLLLWFYT